MLCVGISSARSAGQLPPAKTYKKRRCYALTMRASQQYLKVIVSYVVNNLLTNCLRYSGILQLSNINKQNTESYHEFSSNSSKFRQR